MKKLSLLLFVSIHFSYLFAQNLVDPIYTVKVTPKVGYTPVAVNKMSPFDGSILPNTCLTPAVKTEMDIYEPIGLPSDPPGIKRPVVIWAHGANEVRDTGAHPGICRSLAMRGYVVASISYRLDYLNHFENLIAFLNQPTTKQQSIDNLNRLLYSNSMDIHNGIKYFIMNSTTYKVDTTKFILGGFSLGAESSLFAGTVDKTEISSLFPTNFLTDPFYINTATYRNKIKGIISLSGATLKLPFIQTTDNIPIFLYSGTHDILMPYYIGEQFRCGNPLNPTLYGGAAIAEHIDKLPNPSTHSYYLVAAQGIGHNFISGNFPTTYPSTDALANLWFPDMVRFMKKTMIDAVPYKYFKYVTPYNTSPYNYCNTAMSEPCMNNGIYGALYWSISGIYSCNGTIVFGIGNYRDCYKIPTINGKGIAGIAPIQPTLTLTTSTFDSYYTTLSIPAVFPNPTGATCGLMFIETPDDTHTQLPHKENNIFIYPNPANNKFIIEFDETTMEINHATISDIAGRIVSQEEITIGVRQKEINIENYPTGVYILTLTNQSGDKISQKIIKQ